MVIVAPRQVELHPIVLLCCNKAATTHARTSRYQGRAFALAFFVNSLLFCLLRVAESDSPLYKMEEHRFSLTAALKDVRRYVAGRYMIPPHKVRLIWFTQYSRSTSLGLASPSPLLTTR